MCMSCRSPWCVLGWASLYNFRRTRGNIITKKSAGRIRCEPISGKLKENRGQKKISYFHIRLSSYVVLVLGGVALLTLTRPSRGTLRCVPQIQGRDSGHLILCVGTTGLDYIGYWSAKRVISGRRTNKSIKSMTRRILKRQSHMCVGNSTTHRRRTIKRHHAQNSPISPGWSLSSWLEKKATRKSSRQVSPIRIHHYPT